MWKRSRPATGLLAAWCGIRRGEVIGFFREDVDLDAGTLTVRRNRVELLESPVAFDKDPKSEAGTREINVPASRAASPGRAHGELGRS